MFSIFKPSQACEQLRMQYQSLNKNAWIHEEHRRGRCPRAGVHLPLTEEQEIPETCPWCGEPDLRSHHAALRLERAAERAKNNYHARLRRETNAWINAAQFRMEGGGGDEGQGVAG